MASLAALSSGSSQRSADSRQNQSEDSSFLSSSSPNVDDGGNETMVIRGKEGSLSALDVYTQDDAKSVNSEQQLALRIDKETKPHHHLLRLLKEMDLGDESSDPTKNEAVASLIGDFERDVTQIQQQIQNEKLLKNTAENPVPLPPGWIALECPDTMDIYYANEETGETTWDRPGLDGETNEALLNDSVESSERSDQSDSVGESDDEYGSVENALPPNWIALEDPDSGDMYYANEVTGVTTWDRPGPEAHQEESSYNESVSSGYDDKSQSEYSSSSARFSGSSKAHSVSSQREEEDLQSSSQQDNGTYISSYISQSEEGSHSASFNDKSNNSDFHLSGQTNAEEEEDDDDDLPEGWFSAIDPDSNERYYCNDQTGESQWERPEQEQTSQESSQPSEDNDQSLQDADVSENLPEGWEAILDPSSGEYYYCKWDGTTTWEKPSLDDNSNQDTTQHDVDGLPENWFAVDDPASGDTYYYNEVTNETSWEIPTDTTNLISRLSVQENNSIVYEEDSVTSSIR
mmetsp:Transcript_15577/g.24167  ORF Transcript_15577/g.24167 Transcript_15577/m.24167 type:complete len:518 (+) Transcript_15577:144-1697(+)